MKILALFITLLAIASADVILDGSCPTIRPVTNFDMDAYQGTWYEIKKLAIGNEARGDCGAADYKLVGDVLKLNHSHVVDGVQKSIWGVLTRVDNVNCCGKLTLSTVVADSVRISPHWVVSTDYRNYAIVYSCKYFKKSNHHAVYLWVLSRSKYLSEGATTIVNNFLKEHAKDFPENKFVVSDFSEEACKFKRSSVYTLPFDY